MLRLRLRSRFALTLTACAVLPLGVATAALEELDTRTLKEHAHDLAHSVAAETAGAVDREINAALGELSALAVTVAHPDDDGDEDDKTPDALLRAQIRSVPHVATVALFDAAGRFMYTVGKRDGNKWEDLDTATQALARQNETTALPVILSDGASALPVVRALPHPADAPPLGFIATHVQLRGVSESLRDAKHRTFPDERTRIVLVDDQMRVISAHNHQHLGETLHHIPAFAPDAVGAKQMGQGVSIGTQYISSAGHDVSAQLVSLPKWRWAVIVERDRAAVFAPIDEMWDMMTLTAAGTALLGILAGIFLAGGLARPIERLSAAARKVADGDLTPRVKLRTRDELGDLSVAFNEMVHGLREREQIRDTFGRYVTKELATAILADPAGPQLGGDRREVTILMSDLRGFTARAETLEPEALVALLNRYFAAMAAVIDAHQGHISEFLGDGIVVFFGAPTARPDDAIRAVRCAAGMVHALQRFADDEGLPLEMGIGVHTGQVIAGNIGSQTRLKYGVVGDAINTAARIESFTLGTQVLISAVTATASGVSPDDLGPAVDVQAKGKRIPVRCHPVRSIDGKLLPSVDSGATASIQLDVRCQRLAGKRVVAEELPATTQQVGPRTLTLRMDWDLEERADLKLNLTLPSGVVLRDVYTRALKVTAPDPQGARLATVHITAISDGDRATLSSLASG